ncbi:PepSY domain-containing protein [Streptomyces sp. NPDC052164]|uniref:PepSY domain-containing protein n=1 Tax=Streptomyces sp. NPDC052164 TaxID=3155529 RepID=UPI00344AA9C2
MKRNIAVAAVTAAVLIGGAAATTVAFADDDSDRTARSTGSGTAPKTITTDGDDDTARTVTGTTTISLDEAVAAALKSVPGTVTEAELDDDEDRDVWELDVYGSDKVWHDVTVDARNGTVLSDRDDNDDDRDRHAPKSASLPLDAAVTSALRTAPGSVTSVDLDNDDDDDDGRRGNVLRWDIDIAGKDGRHHELHVDAKTGKVTVDRDDDSDDDRGDDHDDHDDRGDDGDGR